MYWSARLQHALPVAATIAGLIAGLIAGPIAASPAGGAEPLANALRGITGPLSWSAQGNVELERNHFSADGVEIQDSSHGVTRITADHLDANGTDIGNSEWQLTGHVLVQMPQGTLQSDSATVRIDRDRVLSLSAEGAPAQFERAALGNEPPAHGHARRIVYDLERQQLQLEGESWLTDGCNEVASDHIQYDIAAGRVEALSGGGARVHGVIRARAAPQCAGGRETGTPRSKP